MAGRAPAPTAPMAASGRPVRRGREGRRPAAGAIRSILVVAAAFLLLARPGGAQINNCIPPTGRGAPVGALGDLRGSLLVVAYSTGGGRQGKIASGTMDLMAAPASARERGVLMIGSTTLDLARVGGEYAGSLRARDPGAPGVTLEEGRGGSPAVLTFGSLRPTGGDGSARVPVVRFEILERYSKGVRGRWRTVGGSAKAGSGYFCASRF